MVNTISGEKLKEWSSKLGEFYQGKDLTTLLREGGREEIKNLADAESNEKIKQTLLEIYQRRIR